VQHAIATKTINGVDYKPGDAISLDAGIRYAKFGAQFTPMLLLNQGKVLPLTGIT
jgi:opacity protein-like surface antigen